MQLVAAWKVVVLERYAQFSGRASRSEFWWFVLANIVISILLSVLIEISGAFSLLSVVYSLGTILPSLAVGVRRLHDTGRSGWWYLVSGVPLVGLVVLVVLWAGEGQPRENVYGSVPEPLPG